MDTIELIQNYQLSDAVDACKQAIRNKPTDTASRGILCQLFCFQGDWNRADTQLETIVQQDAEMAVGAGLLRQLIRGEIAREQFFTEGRPPELVDESMDTVESLLMAMIAIREGKTIETAQHVAQLHQKIPSTTGMVNGDSFEYARDLDDLMSAFMEVLTTNGKYFLIPISSVASISFRAPERLQDQLWRSANIEVHGGLTGEVYIPTRYCRGLFQDDPLGEPLMMGGETNWVTLGEDGPMTGQGQKMFVFGENAYSIMELETINTTNSDQHAIDSGEVGGNVS